MKTSEQILIIIKNLFKVKSIVTIALTAMFCILAYRGVISGTEFLGIFTVVIGFYFGTQAQKVADVIEAKGESNDFGR